MKRVMERVNETGWVEGEWFEFGKGLILGFNDRVNERGLILKTLDEKIGLRIIRKGFREFLCDGV